MDFAMLPPEVNSARMYAGAGSGPMMVAAAAWDRLAAMLGSAAASYRTVVSELTEGTWQGPSSASMAGAANPYVDWMNATATQAEQTATQARAAAAAFEAAFAATVPPPAIAANRATLLALIATNFFGQNLPAIAANQAEYAEMWAQDAAAMYGYTAHSAAAMVLAPVAPAPQTTNPAAATQAGAQAAGTTQAAAHSATSNSLANLPNIFGPINDFLSNNTTAGINNALGPLGTVLSQFTGPLLASEGIQLFMFPLMTATGKFAMLGPMAAMGAATGAGLMSSTTGELPGYTLAGSYQSGGGSGVSAGMGRAAPIGRLSVPPGWATAAAQEVRLAVSALPTAGPSALPPAGLGGMPAMVPPMGGAVNAPRGADGRLRSASTFKAIQSNGGTTADDDPANQWAYGVAAADVGGLSARELGELDQLREQMSDLALECDAMALLMKEGTN